MSDEKKLNQVSDSSNQTDTDTYMKILKNTDNQPEAAENNSADNTDKDNKYDDNGKHTPRAIKRKKGIIKKISGAFRNPRKRKYAIVITAAAVILISVLTISIAVLLRKDDNSGITDFLPEIVSPDVNEISENNFIDNIEDYISPIDFDELWSTAQDSVAYLYIPGTTVSYPIMQHPTNNEFYLNHAPDKKYDEGGSVYIELSNSSDFTDPVTMIYGHNMNGNENRRFFHFFKDAILIPNIYRSIPMFTFIFRTKRINMRYAVQFRTATAMYFIIMTLKWRALRKSLSMSFILKPADIPVLRTETSPAEITL